jgi:hypothetical protein
MAKLSNSKSGSNTYESKKDNLISFDSFKVRIPIEDVDWIAPEITAERQVVNTVTGEIEAEYYGKTKDVWDNDKTYSFSIGLHSHFVKGQGLTEYAVIRCHSKLLNSLYLEGIDKHNIHVIHYRVINSGLIKVSIEAFLNGLVSDLDMKIDYSIPDHKALMERIKLSSKEYAQSNRGYNHFNQKDNKGIEFGKRATSSPNYPFLKFYYKKLELLMKSKEFTKRYLDAETIDDFLWRCEVTISNKKAFDKYGIKEYRLKDILELTQDKRKSIMKSIIETHLHQRQPEPKKGINVSPTDKLIIFLLEIVIKHGYGFNQIRKSVMDSIEVKSSRFALSNRLESIYNKHFKTDKERQADIKAADAIEGFFDVIGY